jgi:hypothetical protein
MKRFRRRIIFATMAVLVWTGANGFAWADRRVALVVGNSAYQKVTPLPNPRNDATDVAEVLRGLDFEVISTVDADQASFNRALGEFSRKALDADAVLFFYAGHGIQVRGQNYFLPVDADAKDEISAEFEFIAMDRVKQALDKAAANAVRIMVLDACRDNPLARSIYVASRGVGEPTRGLARLDANMAGGTVVVYATQPNQVAQDGSERNSPFTTSFLARLKEPGVEVGSLFRRITEDVRNKTGGKQVPELSISLGRDYYLNRNETDAVAFDRIANSTNAQDFRDFVGRFPGSSRVPLAKRLADMLDANVLLRKREQEEAARAEDARAIAQKEEARKAAEAESIAVAAREQAARDAEEARKKAEAERVAKLEQERRAAEEARKEAARLAKIEADKKEAERLAALKAEAERVKAAEAARLAKIDADKKEAERLAAAKAEEERQRLEGERLAKLESERQAAAAKAEADRQRVEAARLAKLEAEKKEAERVAAVKAEDERQKAEAAARQARLEAEKKEAEQIAAAQAEAERLKAQEAAKAAEIARAEAARREAEEAARLAKTQQETAAAEQRAREAAAAAEAEKQRVAAEEAARQQQAQQAEQRLAAAKQEMANAEAQAAAGPIGPDGVPVGPPQKVVAVASLQADEPVAPPLAQATPVFNTPDLVRAAQTELARLGCYGGKINGKLDRTLDALGAYWKSVNAPTDQVRAISPAVLDDLKAREGHPCGPVNVEAPAKPRVKSARLPERDEEPAAPRYTPRPVAPKPHVNTRPAVQRAAPAPKPARAPVAVAAPRPAPAAAGPKKPFIPMIGN